MRGYKQAAQNGGVMIILPVGIYGAYPAPGCASACYVVQGETATVVLDMGSGSLSLMQKYVSPAKVDAFILSHLHYDHFTDALPLAYYPGKHVIYCPPTPVECFTLLKGAPAHDVRVIGEGASVTVKGMKFDFCRTEHPVETYAVRVTENGKSFVYTADAMRSDKLIEFCRGSELVLTDCSFPAGTAHMTAEQGAELRDKAGVKIVAIHFSPVYDARPSLEQLGIPWAETGKPIRAW